MAEIRDGRECGWAITVGNLEQRIRYLVQLRGGCNSHSSDCQFSGAYNNRMPDKKCTLTAQACR